MPIGTVTTRGNENPGSQGSLRRRARTRARASSDGAIPATTGSEDPSVAEADPPGPHREDGVTFYLNGQTIEVVRVAAALTPGDSMVCFREADVLHMGDPFFAGMHPFVDVASGGRVDGMIATADRGLEIAGPGTRIISGHGPLSGRKDLFAFRDTLFSVRDPVRKMIHGGRDRAAVTAARPAREIDDAFEGNS